MILGGKHRGTRRGTIRGRPLGPVEDVELTGKELANEASHNDEESSSGEQDEDDQDPRTR